MGQTTNQIERQIEMTREDLKTNLEELENKVKSATDWRQYYEKHSGAIVVAAFGGGLLLSSMVGKSRSSTNAGPSNAASLPQSSISASTAPKNEILETFDTVKTALVGAAAMKFKGMLSELVPGFSEQLAKRESDHPERRST